LHCFCAARSTLCATLPGRCTFNWIQQIQFKLNNSSTQI
jgi:hypothetical protein